LNTKEIQQVMANKKKTMGELEQELYEVRQRQTLNQIKTPTPTKLDQLPDPKKHQHVSFVKSGVRIVACILGFVGMYQVGFLGLFLAELIGIYEELV
jgi:hypothetical protein